MIDFAESDRLPDAFYDLPIHAIQSLFPKPTLLHLAGSSAAKPLMISVLLHGNEHTGFYAVQSLLKRYLRDGPGLPRPITLLIGNPMAASQNRRMLVDQEDMNRIWTKANAARSGHLVARIVQLLAEGDYELCLDIHNNTGKNPLYSCIPRRDHQHRNLAGLFAPTCIYFTEPESTQTVFLSRYTAAMTIECGRSASEPGLTMATQLLEALLRRDHESSRPTRDLRVFHTIARLKVRTDIRFQIAAKSFASSPTCSDFAGVDLLLRHDLDELNFSPTREPTLLGYLNGTRRDVIALDQLQESDLMSRTLFVEDDKLFLAPGFVPSMFTLDETVISQDCLGYLMATCD